MLVDWNWARVGNPAVDVAFWLPSLALEGGPTPDEVTRVRPDIAAFAPLVAGFFAAQAGLPAPIGAPAVRGFQLAQLEVALPWAVRAAGLARFSLRAFATDRYEDELAPSDEGSPTWVRLDEVAQLRPLLGNTAEIVAEAAHVLQR